MSTLRTADPLGAAPRPRSEAKCQRFSASHSSRRFGVSRATVYRHWPVAASPSRPQPDRLRTAAGGRRHIRHGEAPDRLPTLVATLFEGPSAGRRPLFAHSERSFLLVGGSSARLSRRVGAGFHGSGVVLLAGSGRCLVSQGSEGHRTGRRAPGVLPCEVGDAAGGCPSGVRGPAICGCAVWARVTGSDAAGRQRRGPRAPAACPRGWCVRPWRAGLPAVPPSARCPPAAAVPLGSGWPARARPPRTPR